ncbi:pentapeptide repeat-containing protein [Rothia aeria]
MAEKTKKAQIFKRDNTWWSKNWFYTILIAVAVIGGVCAFWVVPFVVPQPFSKDDSISTLRQAVLVATGGFLAILTLWENRRKNDQEHMRQVHAERRARYAKAIEQLADEKAPIRLGGVYTLIKLVDEWLADEKTLPNEEERREEGQVIINSLCAYIRSPFDLASKTEVLSQNETPENYEGGNQQFIKDQARLREEKELRLTILNAIKTRLNSGTIIQEKGTEKILKVPWSDFDYDFSGAFFFYSIGFNNSYFGASSNFSGVEFTEKAEFSEAKFFQDADFSGVKLTEASFFMAEFTEKANFSGAEFTEKANFSGAKFIQDADFSGAKLTETSFLMAEFTEKANFSGAEFTEKADFSGAAFLQEANFSRATFTGDAKFAGATFTQDADFSGTKFIQDADFSGTKFTQGTNSYGSAFFPVASFSGATFAQDADFSGARFIHGTIFSGAEFTRANFSGAEFNQDVKAIFQVVSFSGTKFIRANFSGTEFILNADFSRTEFTQEANFSKATFQAEPIFKSTLGNEARFSYKANPEDYNFKVSHNSPYKIETKEQEHNGIKFVIPEDAELFDPDEPSE